jgi:hypothetical protein
MPGFPSVECWFEGTGEMAPPHTFAQEGKRAARGVASTLSHITLNNSIREGSASFPRRPQLDFPPTLMMRSDATATTECIRCLYVAALV